MSEAIGYLRVSTREQGRSGLGLAAQPPLSQRKVNFRGGLDASLGEWPDNAVAKAWTRRRFLGYQILQHR